MGGKLELHWECNWSDDGNTGSRVVFTLGMELHFNLFKLVMELYTEYGVGFKQSGAIFKLGIKLCLNWEWICI